MALPTLITFVAGEDALAEDVNANFDAIAGRFNGGILDQDISDGAAIKGYKLSSASGEQVPESRLGNNAVSARVLQSDLLTGAPSAAVGTAAHIKDGIITAAKLAPLAFASLYTTKTFAFSQVLANNAAAIIAVVPSPVVPRSANVLIGYYIRAASIGASYTASFVINTADATNWTGWLTIKDVGGGGGTAAGDLVMIFCGI
jgi:hypothetical protein